MTTHKRSMTLLARIEKFKGQTPSATGGCALKRKGCGCQGRGYLLAAQAGVVRASVCTCVQHCQVCYGEARLMVQRQLKDCHSPSPLRIVNAYNEAKISSLYLGASLTQFSNFSGNGREKLAQVQEWVRKFNPLGGPGLIISGLVGVGKTYLLAAIAKHFIEQGLQVRFVDFHRMLSVIRQAYAEKKADEEIIGPLVDADILLIDELGKGRGSDWEQEKLDQIVMGRYNQNKVIIASTNYTLKNEVNIPSVYNVDLEQGGMGRSGSFNPDAFETLEARIGKRIFSRIYATSLLIELTGKDFRRHQPKFAKREHEL